MAELVYARALGARGATHGGSSPLPSTKTIVSKSILIGGYIFLPSQNVRIVIFVF